MMAKGEIRFGDVVWVEFDPSVGHEYQSKRPAIVVQSDEQLKKTNLVTIIPLTSQKDNRMSDDILVEARKENNLMTDSVAKVYCVTSFDYARFEKVIGKINEEMKMKISNGGFVGIKYLIPILLIILIGLGVYLAILWQFGDRETGQICETKEKELEININEPLAEPVDGLYGFYHYVYINPKTLEVERIFFKQDGRFSALKQLTNNGYYKSDLQLFSSDSFRFGYFQNVHRADEYFDENNDEQREKYYQNYTSLIINSGYGSTPIEIYRGNDHTSSWEWEDIDHVKVYNNCGTCCRYYYLININTQKIEEEGHFEAEEAACMQIH